MERLMALINQSDSDDSDEELFSNRERNRDFDYLDDVAFKRKYRLNKTTVHSILDSIEEKLEYASDKRNCCVSPINQILCALRFYGTGGYHSNVADVCGVSTSTAHRIVHKVSHEIALLRPSHIYFPTTPDEMRKTRKDFYHKAKFPDVIGAIGGTHIKYSKSPSKDDGIFYKNRKGYYSLLVQAIGNANREFLDIVARWPGGNCNCHVFNNCRQRKLFEQGKYENAVLLGDESYECSNYMITPLHECNTRAENLFNESQIRTRYSTEQMLEEWKRRFPAMALGLNVTVDNSLAMIVATAVLHNIARRARDQLPPDDPEVLLPASWDEVLAQSNMNERYNRANQNDQRRRDYVDKYFASLVRIEE